MVLGLLRPYQSTSNHNFLKPKLYHDGKKLVIIYNYLMGKLIFQIVYPYPKDTSKNIYPHNIDFKPIVQK